MLKRLSILTIMVLAACFSQAEEKYQEGVHYTVLDTPLKTTFRGEQIGEIMEFFSYSCIHCYNLEPSIERYMPEKPENIKWTPVPVMFNDRQAPEVRAYYVLKVLKLGEEAHKAIFEQIHKNRKSMRSDAQFAKFFKEFGISEDRYMKEAYSFGVNAQLNRSIYLTKNSQIQGTPGIVANGKYLINSGAVGGNELAIYAAQWLIQNDPAK